MAMVIAQVWCRCWRMLVHGVRLHTVQDLQDKNRVCLRCLAEASSVENTSAGLFFFCSEK